MKSAKPARPLALPKFFKTPSGFLLRRVRHSDLDSICHIENEAHLRPWSRDGLIRELLPESPSVFWAGCPKVALEEVVAYICFRIVGTEFYLLNIAVKEGFRHRGLGYWLLLSAIDFGLKRGIKEAVLDVHRENHNAIGFYQALGFRFADPKEKNKKIFRVMEMKFP